MTGRRREPVLMGMLAIPFARAPDRAFTWSHVTVDWSAWYRVPAVAADGTETTDGD
jgi:hypothetical protein